jgi:hypothetical protein
MWKDAADDDANTTWHQECVALMKPYITGYYIGETDPVAIASDATGAFSPESWKLWQTCAKSTIRTASSSRILTDSPNPEPLTIASKLRP